MQRVGRESWLIPTALAPSCFALELSTAKYFPSPAKCDRKSSIELEPAGCWRIFEYQYSDNGIRSSEPGPEGQPGPCSAAHTRLKKLNTAIYFIIISELEQKMVLAVQHACRLENATPILLQESPSVGWLDARPFFGFLDLKKIFPPFRWI